jgi:DNA-binding transcriptional MerR regulator
MEKVLIEQLLNSGISLKKIKSIIENTEKAKEQNLNETISANTCGLKLMVCSGCHKTMYEDKFMLNKMNKRYRSCINCVSRARITRQSKDKDKQTTTLKDKHNDKMLAILDKQEDEAYNIEPNTKLIDYPHIEPQEPDFPIEPNTDISNYSHIEPITITKHKHHSKQKKTTCNPITIQFPEPSDLSVGLRNLFSST